MMKKFLVIALCLGFLALSACSGRRPTRCDQWGWYKPCDLIEGRASQCSPGPCGYPAYQRGQVVERTYAVPAADCAPPAATQPMPAPAPAAAPPAVEVVEEVPPPAAK